MEAKEVLINAITLSLISCNDHSVESIKKILSKELESYSITEIRETLPASNNGEATIYLMRKFAEAKTAAGMKERTLQQYYYAVRKFCKLEKIDLNLATADNINHFVSYMRNYEKLSDVTIRGDYVKLRSVYTFLFNHKYIADNPMLETETPKFTVRLKKPLKEAEIERIKIACEHRRRYPERSLAMIYFFLDTGVRVSEFCSLDVQDVDFEELTALVRKGKGGKDRMVYFTEKTKVRLLKYLETRQDIEFEGAGLSCESGTPLFMTCRNVRVTKESVEQDMRSLAKESGVARLHPHLLRATFATRLAERGVGIEIIAKLLGHANLHTINRYVLLSDDKIKLMLRNAA